jgi:hypothetical protein
LQGIRPFEHRTGNAKTMDGFNALLVLAIVIIVWLLNDDDLIPG